MTDWQPISTAPRDGTEVELTAMDNGEPQEVWPMQWVAKAELWAMHSKLSGALLSTWSEEDADGAPTHWRPILARRPRGVRAVEAAE